MTKPQPRLQWKSFLGTFGKRSGRKFPKRLKWKTGTAPEKKTAKTIIFISKFVKFVQTTCLCTYPGIYM